MTRHLLCFLSIIFIFSSCSLYKIDSEDVTAKFYPAKSSPQEVQYVENLTAPHEVIGFITVNSERVQTLDEVIEKMKREAAILGGDAITNITTNATGTWKKLPPQKLLANAYIRANFTATVVAYK